MIKLELNPGRPLLRQFAWAGLFMFPLLGFFLRWMFGLPLWAAIALAALGVAVFAVQLGLVPIVPPRAGDVLERAVTRTVWRGLVLVGYPIGLVVSHVLLAGIYYLVFTPIGLAFKLIGRDAMKRRLEPDRPSYWEPRPAARDPASYFKLY